MSEKANILVIDDEQAICFAFTRYFQQRGYGVQVAASAAAGLEAFVRAGYVYVLGRPADHAGMSAYVTRLGNQSITPWDFIKELYDSAEFNAAPRLLAAPSEPGFAFRRS